MPRSLLPLLLALLALSVGAGTGVLRLQDEAGEPVEISGPRDGETLIVHFWASWCPTCPEDMRELELAYASCAADRVRVLTVNVAEDWDTIADFVDETGLTLPVLRDPSGSTWRGTGAMGLPSNLVWGPQGRRIEVGPKDGEAWRVTLRSVGCGPELPASESTRHFPDAQTTRG